SRGCLARICLPRPTHLLTEGRECEGAGDNRAAAERPRPQLSRDLSGCDCLTPSVLPGEKRLFPGSYRPPRGRPSSPRFARWGTSGLSDGQRAAPGAIGALRESVTSCGLMAKNKMRLVKKLRWDSRNKGSPSRLPVWWDTLQPPEDNCPTAPILPLTSLQ